MQISKTTPGQGFLNMLVYGQPGTGKTRFCGSAEPRFKTLIASAESGLLSLNNNKVNGEVFSYDYVKVTKFEEIEEIYKFLAFSKHDYKLLALDSGTELQKVCMDFILREEKIEKPRIQDWGTLNDKMTRLIRTMRDLPIHLIMTSLMDEDKDELTGEVKVYPSFQGKISKSIGGYFDEVFYSYCTSKKSESGNTFEYKLLTQNSGKYLGKDRSGKLPQIINPNFCEIYDTIFETNKETK